MSQALLQALHNKALYPHEVEAFELIETHISWVLLTGPYAYKIKKPVNFGFLDFSSLAARQHFCAQEVQLNQRLTQGLYLEVLPITGSEQAPQLGGSGAPIEYAIKMRQFPQSLLLSAVQARGELSVAHIDALALQIAQFHAKAPVVPADNPLGSSNAVMAPVRQNFEQIRALLPDGSDLPQLQVLEDWAENQFERLKETFEQRKRDGFVRECHGDIHLNNCVLLDEQPVLFDCIEFNEPFRFTDTCSDIAFLVMDLQDRGLDALANRLISLYLEYSGDYAALSVLNFYKAYRAMVRAKVALFSLAHQSDEAGRAAVLAQYRNYAQLAERYCHIPARFLALTCGVSASGKSHAALELVEQLGAIRLRSDVERKRLFGEPAEGQAGNLLSGIYQPSASEATYQHLHQLAGTILATGFAVVLDASYLHQAQRRAALAVAEQAAVPYLIIDCQANETALRVRLAQRQQTGLDPSDATWEVIEYQLAHREPLTAREQSCAWPLDTTQADALAQLSRSLKTRLSGF